MTNELVQRRDVLLVLIGLAACSPARMPRIGILMPLGQDDSEGQVRLSTLRGALQELGWVENRNVRIDVRWGPANVEKYRELATELVSLSPDILVAGGGLVVAPLQRTTKSIPIVFTATVDPLALGYVTSLSRPGGNTTGFINFEYSLCGKWLEKLKAIAPHVRRVAVLLDRTGPGGVGIAQFKEIQRVAPQHDVEITSIDVKDPVNLEQGLAREADRDSGLIITASTFATVHRDLIITLAARHRLPAIYPVPFYVKSGGLISYGAVFLDQYRHAADYVDRILKGAKPGDLPVQGPTRFEMAVNLKTARELGLEVPKYVLAGADQVIE